jgi:hypothetical protein
MTLKFDRAYRRTVLKVSSRLRRAGFASLPWSIRVMGKSKAGRFMHQFRHLEMPLGCGGASRLELVAATAAEDHREGFETSQGRGCGPSAAVFTCPVMLSVLRGSSR